MPQDRDLAADAFHLHAVAWGLAGGSVGALFGYLASSVAGLPLLRSMAVGFLVVAIVVSSGIVALAHVSSLAVASSVAPSGQSTPGRAEYSQAKTFAVQGRYAEAVTEYERHIAENPDDPEPCLLLARLHRDELKQLESAIRWFRQAIAVATDPGVQCLGVRELTEVCVNRLGEPRRALPDLARLADRNPGSVGSDWARNQLDALKRDISWET